MLQSTSDFDSSELGWALGYYGILGSFDSTTSMVVEVGMHCERHKEAGAVSYRGWTWDAMFYPITSLLSLDVGVEMNALILASDSDVDHGWPAWADASLYLGRRIALGLNVAVGSLILRH